MKKLIQIFCFLFIVTFSFNNLSAQEVSVGDKISKLEIEHYLQAPQNNYSYDKLKENALVLEFWATWCSPCIALIPHLNHLNNVFSNQPVRFISITSEKKSIITNFLKYHKMNGWVGLDTDKSVFNKFNIIGVPQTVLIYPSGKVAAITYGSKVSTKTIHNLINEMPLEINDNKSKGEPNGSTGTSIFTSSTSKNQIHPTQEPESYTDNLLRFGIYNSKSISLRKILAAAYDVSKNRITGDSHLLNKNFYISWRADKSGKNFLKLLQHFVISSLNLKIKHKKQKMGFYILEAPNGAVKGLRVYKSSVKHKGIDSGVIVGSSRPINVLVSQLRAILDAPVINKTNLNQQYAWAVIFDEDHPKSLITALKKQLGLILKKKYGNMKVLVVRQK